MFVEDGLVEIYGQWILASECFELTKKVITFVLILKCKETALSVVCKTFLFMAVDVGNCW